MKSPKNQKNKRPEKATGHFKRNVILFLLLVAISVSMVIFFYAQKTAQGIVKVEPQNNLAQTEEKKVPGLFSGEYLSFSYENGYVVKSHDVATKKDAVILEQAYLSQDSAVSKKIGLTIRSLPSWSLDDCPDYTMRLLKPDQYKKDSFNLGNIAGTSFEVTGDGTFEKTFFLLHGNYLAIITMTAPTFSNQQLNDEIAAIVSSVSWLK